MSGLSALCASTSVALGAIYMFAAGAPRRYILLNTATLVIGVTALRAIKHRSIPDRKAGGVLLVAIGIVLLATAFFGVRVDGASRWFRVDGITLQPSLILLPYAMVRFAGNRDWWSAIGVMLSGVALATQPDRAMAGTLAVGLMALWRYHRDRPVTAALAVAILGFASTMLSADAVAPVPFVERVVQSAFAFHLLTGVAVTAGLASLLVPAIVHPGSQPDNRATSVVFAVTWLVVIGFALVGDYPTPVVGYGSSAILGYCLSTVVLARRRQVEIEGA